MALLDNPLRLRAEGSLYPIFPYDPLRSIEVFFIEFDSECRHAAATEEISELAQYNIDKVCEIADSIVRICEQPFCFEAILQRLFTDYGLDMTFEQYVLVGSTVRSYLAWLKDTGRLNGLFKNNMLMWQQIMD